MSDTLTQVKSDTAHDHAPTKLAQIEMGDSGISLRTFDDVYRFSKAVALSGWAPKGMEKPESILVAIQFGLEIGLSPMAALQNTAVINGRPGIYGDAALALVRASGLLESYSEKIVGTPGKDDFGMQITTKRKGEEVASETFTIADAKTAGLWGKQGPWTQYPKRMLKFRARGFLLRDIYGDVLKGLRTVEELRDMPEERNVTPPKNLAQLAAASEAPAELEAAETIPPRDTVINEIEDYLLVGGMSEKAFVEAGKKEGIFAAEVAQIADATSADLLAVKEISIKKAGVK